MTMQNNNFVFTYYYFNWAYFFSAGNLCCHKLENR